jgi:hypothetical protein
MKSKFTGPKVAFILFLTLAPCLVLANEMQRLVFNAAADIGMAIVTIDNQGITPENSASIRANLDLAATQLTRVAGMYQDPPFEVEAINALPPKLSNFFQATERMNNAQRMFYLSGVYSNLKSAMTLAYSSRRGTYYCATCDTFVVDLGHFMGQAYQASILNDAQTVSMARSRVNLAISEGIKASGALGCSFPSWSQWQQLGIGNARTSADWTRIGREAENLFANAAGLSSAIRVPSSHAPLSKHVLSGTYGLRGEFVVSLENGRLVCRQVKGYGGKPPPPASDNIVFELNAVPEDGSFIERSSGNVAYRGRWRLNLNMPWQDCFAQVDAVYGDEPLKWFSLNLWMCTRGANGRWQRQNYFPKLLDPNRPPNQ